MSPLGGSTHIQIHLSISQGPNSGIPLFIPILYFRIYANNVDEHYELGVPQIWEHREYSRNLFGFHRYVSEKPRLLK